MEPGATIYQLFETNLMFVNLYFVYNVKGTKSIVQPLNETRKLVQNLGDKMSLCINLKEMCPKNKKH